MKKIIFALLFLFFPFTLFAQPGNFFDFGPDFSFQVWQQDPNGYFGVIASPPTVASALEELGASHAVVNSTYLKLDASNDPLTGNLEVGTSGTGYDVKFYGATAGHYLYWDKTSNKLWVYDSIYANTVDFDNTNAGLLNVDNLNTNLIPFEAGSSDLGSQALPFGSAWFGATTIGADAAGYDVKIYGATTANYLFYDASANNLGMNTETPKAALEIKKWLNAPDDLGDYDNYQMVIEGNTTTGRTAGMLFSTTGDTAGGSAIIHYDTGAGGLGDLAFYTKQSTSAIPPVEVMRLTDDGNVGIGTATPATKLDVQGAITVGINDTGYDVKFYGATAGKYLLWDNVNDALVLSSCGLVIPSGTTPAPAIQGALFLDTDASTNGDLVCYGNGAWRKIISLP